MHSIQGMTPEFEDFLRTHRWGVLSTLRASGSPVNSVVAYACEETDVVISTPGATFKRRSAARDERVNLCAISNSEPFNFVAVEGRATVQTEAVAEPTARVFAALAEVGYELPDPLDEWLERQDRVIIRIKIDRAYGVIR